MGLRRLLALASVVTLLAGRFLTLVVIGVFLLVKAGPPLSGLLGCRRWRAVFS